MENINSHLEDIWKTKPVLIEGSSKRGLKKTNSNNANENCIRSCSLSPANGDFLSTAVGDAIVQHRDGVKHL